MNNKQLLAQYDANYLWFKSALEGFTDEETNLRLHKEMNHIKYIAGHLVNTQYAFAVIANVPVERKWDDLFAGQGKTKALDNYPYPSIEEIKHEWEELYQPIRRGLAKLTEKDLEQEIAGSPIATFKSFDSSIGDFWAFFNIHQTNHIGQMGILRRGFGKKPMRYF